MDTSGAAPGPDRRPSNLVRMQGAAFSGSVVLSALLAAFGAFRATRSTAWAAVAAVVALFVLPGALLMIAWTVVGFN